MRGKGRGGRGGETLRGEEQGDRGDLFLWEEVISNIKGICSSVPMASF